MASESYSKFKSANNLEKDELEFGIKVPSIHWNNNQGKREAEKRAGLIADSGDLDYAGIFSLQELIYEDVKLNIIFDGVGLNKDANF